MRFLRIVQLLAQAGLRISNAQNGNDVILQQPVSDRVLIKSRLIPVVHLAQRRGVVDGIKRIMSVGIGWNKLTRNQGCAEAGAFTAELGGNREGCDDPVAENRLKTFFRNLLKGLIDDLPESFGIFPVQIHAVKYHHVLRAGILKIGSEVSVGKGFLEPFHHRGPVVHQQVCQRVQDHFIQGQFFQPRAQEGVINNRSAFCGEIFLHCIGIFRSDRFGQRNVIVFLKAELAALILRKLVVQQLKESGIVLKFSVQICSAIGRVVIEIVIGLQIFPGHFGNMGRIPTRVVSAGCAWEACADPVVVRLAADVHGGAHLAVNRSFNGKVFFQAAQTVTPCFLAEDVFVFHEHRVHAAVQVEVRILKKLSLGEACHRVGGIGLTGCGIHISIIGLVQKIKEQIV